MILSQAVFVSIFKGQGSLRRRMRRRRRGSPGRESRWNRRSVIGRKPATHVILTVFEEKCY